MKKTLLLAALIGCTCLTQAQDTFVELTDHIQPTAEDWKEVKNIRAAWGTSDVRYAWHEMPNTEALNKKETLTAWRGERVSAQALIYSGVATDSLAPISVELSSFKSGRNTLPADAVKASFVRYVKTDSWKRTDNGRGDGCGRRPDRTVFDSAMVADIIDIHAKTMPMEAMSTRSVWVSCQVPADAVPGIYSGTLNIKAGKRSVAKLPLQIEVLSHTLPAPKDWEFHLDLWQNPFTEARYYNTPLWSEAHFEAMRPSIEMLAAAGQKVITTTLNKDPWNHQCYDAYEDMIRWTLRKDGSWSYDYTNFDRWVEMMLTTGINKMINCYSMVPWNCELHYMDEAKGEMVTVKAEPGKPIFNDMWSPFLKDFKQHLQQKGWLSITNIAMDERSPEQMDAAAKLLQECAPELGFALADNHNSYKRYTMMNDVCAALRRQLVDHEDIVMRRAKNQNTTFYVCCGPYFPNTFTWSQPYEAEMLGWLNVTYDYDGMLRWAYNSWPSDPQMDSRFGSWPAGDTYLTYPQCRSSLRFERLIDGIESAEKVRRLRAAGVDISDVEAMLTKIRNTDFLDHKQSWLEIIKQARATLDEASRK